MLEEYLKDAKVDIIMDSIKIKYMPNEEDLNDCINYGKEFGNKILKNPSN